MYCSLVVQAFYYFSGIHDFGIIFQANYNSELVDYTNSDYEGLVDGQKFTRRYIFMLLGGFLSY